MDKQWIAPSRVRADEDDEDDDESDEPRPAKADPKAGARPDLFERLLKSRTVVISSGVDDKTASRVIHELLALEADDAEKPITIFMNTPGGSITSGFAIYDMIRFVRPRVRIVCAGLTASMGTILLLAVDKADRLALPNAEFLIHQPLIAGNVYGPTSDLEITANEILKTRAKLNRLLSEQTGQALERIERDSQRDYWMTAQEAQSYGLIAKVVTQRAELDD
ncbi:MAG: ATP-dependent Clp protease proteolytic subunit [Deltaproteobacteria bacterium]|nr:ATP-dependent Clp protease proteolytic subunit [Deltaproteobacteria bacterium]